MLSLLVSSSPWTLFSFYHLYITLILLLWLGIHFVQVSGIIANSCSIKSSSQTLFDLSFRHFKVQVKI